jgi:hypothetical protein
MLPISPPYLEHWIVWPIANWHARNYWVMLARVESYNSKGRRRYAAA